jgi:hypothetical protein
MTENEKLRALLAEAHGTLRDFAENWDCDSDAHKYGTTCRVCDAETMKKRIDAALAEPYHIPPSRKCFRWRKGEKETCCAVENTNHWTEEYDYYDERNFTHYAPCPLARTWDKP